MSAPAPPPVPDAPASTRLPHIVAQLPLCIHGLSLEGRFLAVNPAGLLMVGCGRAKELVGRNYLELADPGERLRLRGLLQQALAGETVVFEFVAANARRYRSCLSPQTDASGRVLSLLGYSEDVTVQHQLMEGMRWRAIEDEALTTLLQLNTQAHSLPNYLCAVTEILARAKPCRKLAEEAAIRLVKDDAKLMGRPDGLQLFASTGLDPQLAAQVQKDLAALLTPAASAATGSQLLTLGRRGHEIHLRLEPHPGLRAGVVFFLRSDAQTVCPEIQAFLDRCANIMGGSMAHQLAEEQVSFQADYDRLVQEPAFRKRMVLTPHRRALWLMLQKDRIDGVIADEWTAVTELPLLDPAVRIVASRVVVSDKAVGEAFSRRTVSPEFVQRYDRVINDMKSDGSFQAVVQRYMAAAAAPR